MNTVKENNKNIELIAFSAAALYLELAIIRFTAAEVLYLGYFSNFILISSFVGLGLGFLSKKEINILDEGMPFFFLFLFSIVLVSEFDVSILKNHFGLFFFGNLQGRAGLPGALLLVILFTTTVFVFAGIGRRIAVAFKKFTPLKAYSLDITGSLLGIVIFTLQSYVASGPIIWIITGGLFLSIGYITSADDHSLKKLCNVIVASICVIVLIQSASSGVKTIWSSYQKLEFVEGQQNQPGVVYANGIMHQFLHPVETTANSYYDAPYTLLNDLGRRHDDVLIVGAGAGTDVGVALLHGSKNIDAVEIDKRIVEIGKKFHPNHPYSDPRVKLHIEDGRQFLKTNDKKYDLIVFALPDSLMRLSAMSSVRLESFLFTLEAFADVKNRLKEDGVFVMYNQYRWPWLVNKLSAGLYDVFGTNPLQGVYNDTTVLAVGRGIEGEAVSNDGFKRLATDDWPFVYMQEPGIHWLYIGMIAMFMTTAIVGVFLLGPTGTLRRPEYGFFFMGMAFLLLETKSLVFFSLLFGTTWIVNSLAFTGILISVLLANLIVQYCNIQAKKNLFVGLFVCLFIAYFVPPAIFLEIESLFVRYLLAIALVFSPIFFANLIFSREFKDSEESTRAFGWNLLGAVAGGGLEYFSLLIGFKNLLWIVALCYILVALATHKGRKLTTV
jgi:SAM-dependent methyltransferase